MILLVNGNLPVTNGVSETVKTFNYTSREYKYFYSINEINDGVRFNQYYLINNNFLSKDEISMKIEGNRCLIGDFKSNIFDPIEKNFTLNGKVWLIKITLNEPAKLLNHLTIRYTARTNRLIKAHRHVTDAIILINDSRQILFGVLGDQYIYFISHPHFYHLNNVTIDHMKEVLNKDTRLDTCVETEIFNDIEVFDSGVYYLILGAQAYTVKNDDYRVSYNISFSFPENYSMTIECYRQDDPIGVSFSEMNASYVYWDTIDFDGKGRDIYTSINGEVLLKPNHTLLYDDVPPRYTYIPWMVLYYDQ